MNLMFGRASTLVCDKQDLVDCSNLYSGVCCIFLRIIDLLIQGRKPEGKKLLGRTKRRGRIYSTETGLQLDSPGSG